MKKTLRLIPDLLFFWLAQSRTRHHDNGNRRSASSNLTECFQSSLLGSAIPISQTPSTPLCMPFTPYHLGPGLLLKSVLSHRFSLMVFACSQFLLDLEPLFYLSIHILFSAAEGEGR